FTEATLAKMKSELKDEIETSDKSARDKLIPELFNGLPIGYSKSDILSSIDNVTLDDVKALHKYIIENGQANVVVSAPFSKKPELKQILFNEIAELPTVKEKNFDMQKIYSPQKEQKVLTDVHNKPQAEIIKAYKFPVNQNLKDEITLNILNTILGANPSSRLFQDLREAQKLAYAVRSGFSITGDTGVMTLSIKTTTENKETGEVSYENLQKSINGFNKHINRIMSENVTEKELENAKLSIKNSILNMNETNGGKNKSIQAGLISPYGISQENQILKLIDEITVEDINNAAKYVFSGKSVYSILATENTLKENKKYLDNLV
ncbi:insulinase family protein, partial [bacterium]|nr:insulinase family protein [bacterium]